ncbi:MAG: NAD(P)-dependent oxidoreductase [Gammaproteobacteria bacterium]
MDIGIIGIGLMGRAFVERFRSQGLTVGVFNRTRETVTDLEESGVTLCASVDELIGSCDTMILMVSHADAIREVLSLDRPEAQAPALQGKRILQMATIAPSQSLAIEEAISSRGGRYLEAPVLGSLPEARAGTLIVMAGGPQAVYEEALPVLQVLGSAPRHVGQTGSAAALKLAMNQLIAALTAGFSLSLGYAMKNGVEPEVFMDTVRESALYAKTYDKKLDKYLSRDFGKANFSTRHLLKDIRLFIDDASAAGLNTAALEGIEQITRQTVEEGFDVMDYSSIFRSIVPEE